MIQKWSTNSIALTQINPQSTVSRALYSLSKNQNMRTQPLKPQIKLEDKKKHSRCGFTSLAIKTQPSSFHILDLGPGNGGVRRVTERKTENSKNRTGLVEQENYRVAEVDRRGHDHK